MESLEPVAPVAAAAEAAARRPAEAEGAEARAAELVQAAEGQVTELRRRLEATSELLRAAESEAASSQQMVAAREAEAARLLETLGGEGTGGQAEGHALKQAEGREQQQQLGFLNQQVDFLNEWPISPYISLYLPISPCISHVCRWTSSTSGARRSTPSCAPSARRARRRRT